MTELFFDDQALFVRENLVREYASPEVVGEYYDPSFSIDYPFTTAFRLNDGRTRLLYMGRRLDGTQGFFTAVSDDGIRFEPDPVDVTFAGKHAPHQFRPAPEGDEIAAVIEDKTAPAAQRYKMLLSSFRSEWHYCNGPVFTSPDLLHWTPLGNRESWCGGSEPVTGCFYNEERRLFTILRRPWWGDRRVGMVETADFTHYTDYEPVLQADCLDEPLDELYGMPAFAYEGMYVGFPQILTDNRQVYGGKSNPGNLVTQLAYSYDGRHWNRCLRESYYKGYHGQPCCMWFGKMLPDADGSLLMYSTYTPHDHGHCFDESTDGRVRIYRARKDGFVKLTAAAGQVGRLATRHRFWQGGDLHVNLTAARATVQVMLTDNEFRYTPAEGFTHADCEPFCGDSTDWIPRFKGGGLDRFIDLPVFFEIKLEDGSLYALRHNGFQLMSTQVRRYFLFGKDQMIFDAAHPYPAPASCDKGSTAKTYEFI